MIKEISLVINEQHTFLPEQERVLWEKFPQEEYKIRKILIPAEGLDRDQQQEYVNFIPFWFPVVFVSPVPLMIKMCCVRNYNIWIFCNDKREKVELPNGKVSMKVADTGWYLA